MGQRRELHMECQSLAREKRVTPEGVDLRLRIGTAGERAVAFLLDGVFIGATRTRELMVSMAVSLAVFLVASWAFMPVQGNHGLWAALMVFMAVRGATLMRLLPRVAHSIPAEKETAPD